MKTCKVFLFVVVLVLPLLGWTQKIQYTNYRTADGLPSPEAYFVKQDITGYFWIGTDRGLSRYDGYKFTNFSTANSGLTNNTVLNVYEAPNADLWFTCYDGSITVYHPKEQEFEPFLFNDSLRKWYTNWPNHVTFHNGGAVIYQFNDLLNHAVVRWNSGNPSIQNRAYNVMNRVGEAYFSDIDKTAQIYHDSLWGEDHLFTNKVGRGMNLDSTNRVLLGNTVRIGKKLFFYYDYTLYALHNKTICIEKEFEHPIGFICANRSGELMISTGDGLYRKEEERVLKVIDGMNITYVSQDVEGNYWLATLKQGVIRIPDIGRWNQLDLQEQEITALCGHNEHLLIGVPEAILAYGKDKKIESLVERFSGEAKQIRIKSFIKNRGRLVATGPFQISQQDSHLLANRMFDKRVCNHTIYIGNEVSVSSSFGNGYYVINGRDSSSQWYEGIDDVILWLDQDNDGLIWVGTLNGVWNLRPDALDKPIKNLDFDSLNDRINQIAHTRNDLVIFATGAHGLILKRGDKSKIINISSGLPSDVVNSIALQEDSILWVGTNKGVSRLRISNSLEDCRVEYSLNADDGLLSNYIYCLEVWNNKLWLGTDDGLLSIALHKAKPKVVAPKIVFEQIKVGQDEMLGMDATVFKYTQNDIAIHYVGISFNKPESGFYRYRLRYDNDYDTTYTYTDNTSVNFLNLNPGRYVFEVACRNKNNIWSESITYKFHIVPHYTQTTWFKVVVILGISILLIIIIWWQYREIKRKNEKESQLKELEFKFKESELAILRNQMNPHFVFNALNSIQSYILQSDPETASGYVQRFSVLMRSSLEYTMDDWISLRKEIDFLSNYLHIEQLRFPNRFKFEITCHPDVDMEEVNVPPLLVQPFVENCVKHAFTPEEKNGMVTVHFEMDGDEIVCTVVDNGIGILQAEARTKLKHRSYGVEVVRNRLNLLNNEADNSEKLTYVDLEDKGTGTTGTKVIIRIPTE